MIKFSLTPVDVLFFGKGRPFNFSVQEAETIFPPLPNTLASSLCAKIFHEKGINVKNIIKQFFGPFLEKNGDIIFPKPLDILRERREMNKFPVALLKNNFELIHPSYTNTDKLKGLLWIGGEEFETFEGFIKLNGLKKWLNNQKEIDKDDLVPKEEIFYFEDRIGIRMDYSRNATREEDALYRISFVRLQKDVKIVFFVEFNEEEEIFNFFKNNSLKVLKLGGEMRSVYYNCERKDISEFGFKPVEIKENDIIKILYLTPGTLDTLSNEDYEFISGVIFNTKLIMKSKNYGEKIKKGIKEGSVIYVKVKDKEKIKDIFLKPKDGEFIGSNLRIYTKIEGG